MGQARRTAKRLHRMICCRAVNVHGGSKNNFPDFEVLAISSEWKTSVEWLPGWYSEKHKYNANLGPILQPGRINKQRVCCVVLLLFDTCGYVLDTRAV